MNMPSNVVLAVKESSLEQKESIKKEKTSIFDKISSSYSAIESDIESHVEHIKRLRSDAGTIKSEIHLKKNVSVDTENMKPQSVVDGELFEKKIVSNNTSMKEKTCATAINLINDIKINIGKDSKSAKNLIAPLEESVDLLKTQVKYTMVLEETLEVFNEKKKLEKKKEEIDQIITMLEESMSI